MFGKVRGPPPPDDLVHKSYAEDLLSPTRDRMGTSNDPPIFLYTAGKVELDFFALIDKKNRQAVYCRTVYSPSISIIFSRSSLTPRERATSAIPSFELRLLDR